MNKKAVFGADEVYWGAFLEFANALHEHVETAGEDQLRFQTERFWDCLIKRIKAEGTVMEQWRALFYCYQVVTSPSWHPAYSEARRLHCAEMEARDLPLPGEFCSSWALVFAQASDQNVLLKHLHFRVRSIASFMEAQWSFWVWLVLRDLPSGWRGEHEERRRALQALYLSQLPLKLQETKRRGREVLGACLRPELGVGSNYDNKPWTDRQWKNVLLEAARLVDKKFECTELEKWLWWCYPVFRRCGWNTREVQDAAKQRGFDLARRMYEPNFRRHMLTTGIPLSGKKQRKDRTPPLAEFVSTVVLPGKVWRVLDRPEGGYLTEKNS